MGVGEIEGWGAGHAYQPFRVYHPSTDPPLICISSTLLATFCLLTEKDESECSVLLKEHIIVGIMDQEKEIEIKEIKRKEHHVAEVYTYTFESPHSKQLHDSQHLE